MRSLAIGATREQAYERFAAAAVGTFQYSWRNGAMNPDLEPWLKGVKSDSELNWENLSPEREISAARDDCIGQVRSWFARTGATT